MQIAILGPLEVRDDAGRPIAVAGTRLRSLITRLALEAGRWVSTAALVDAVWGDEPPADKLNALQTLVSRLRRAIGDPAAVESSSAGYRLAVAPEAIDAARFESSVRSARDAVREGRPAEASRLFDDALSLWRGPALGDVTGTALSSAAERLEHLRVGARVERAELRVEGGGADVAELQALSADQPLNEHLAVLLMRALSATGRQADALVAYEALRTRLADELGVDPSAEAQAAHLDLLRGEPAPAPAATSKRSSNLRSALTSFVGREDDERAIRDLLGEQRLVTLVGPGGAGKTRLATEAARGLLDDAPDGVWLAELAAVTAGADVAQAVLASIGLREMHSGDAAAQRDAMARLTTALVSKRMVLVLDNCEHVIDASAELAETLLGECPGLRVLATSREPLGIVGETLFPVPPLARPDGAVLDPVAAAGFASVALFIDRAAAARPDFELDASNVGVVIGIVLRLDGLPLAIELAAARLRSLPLDDVADRLSDRFRLLTGGSRTALPRHRTLRAVVEWSWDLLQPDERKMVERLAVFPAGVTVASANAVRPSGIDAEDVADLLASLVDKSLLQRVGDGRRLRMLETIREYGIERLAERGVLDEARSLHARYFAGLLREAVPQLVTRDQLPWFALLRAELENALAAMRFLAASSDADATLQIAVDLSMLALLVGGQQDAAGWLGEALAVPGGDAQLRTIARAVRAVSTDFSGADDREISNDELLALADDLSEIDVSLTPLLAILRPGVAFVARNLPLARRLIDEAMNDDTVDAWTRAAARLFSVNLYENEGEIDNLRRDAEQALTQFRALGERWGISGALRSVGQVRTLQGDLAGAAALYAESMQLRQELSSQDDTVFLLVELADLALRSGDEAGAREYLQRATAQAEGPSSDFEAVFAWTMVAQLERRTGTRGRARELAAVAGDRLTNVPPTNPMQGYVGAIYFRLIGELALDDGDRVEAERCAGIAYEAAVATHDLPVLASAGVFSAELAEAAGDAAGAARRLGAADRLRGAPDPRSPDIVDLAARIRQLLGDEACEAEFARGRAMSRDEAIAALDPTRPA